jgi:uncharacterized membrane protein
MQNNPIPNQEPFNYQQQQPYHSLPPTKQGKTQVFNLDYNIAGMLCYVPFGFIVAIVLLLTEPKESRFARFHAIQSLLLIAAVMALSTLLSIIGAIAGQIPIIGFVFALLMIPLSLLITVGSIALMVLLIIKAYQNQMWKIPVIGSYAERLASS